VKTPLDSVEQIERWVPAGAPRLLEDNEALKNAALDAWYGPVWRKWRRPPVISRDAITKVLRIIDEHIARGQR
jgi:hypothetical protein